MARNYIRRWEDLGESIVMEEIDVGDCIVARNVRVANSVATGHPLQLAISDSMCFRETPEICDSFAVYCRTGRIVGIWSAWFGLEN